MLKHSTIYAIGNISRQLISFVMLPVYTHYLSPADYGVVGLISFAIAIFETLLGAKMVQALPRYYHDAEDVAEKNAVVSTSFLITGLSSLVTVCAIFFFRETLSRVLFESPRFALVVGLCGIQMLTQALEYYALMYIRLTDRPGVFVAINLVKLASQLIANLVLVVHFKLGVLGVVISGLFTSAAFALALSVWTLVVVGVRFDKVLARKMIAFSWPLWLAGLASLYIYSSNRYFVRVLDSLANVGLFELASKFSGILTLLIWVPFSQYWQTEQFKIMQRPDSAAVFSSVFAFASYLLITVGLGISIYSTTVLQIMAAASFRGAARAVPFLICATILACFTELTSARLLASGETKWLSRNNYVTAMFVTILYACLIPIAGFVGAACALALSQLIQFGIVQNAVRKRYGLAIDFRPIYTMGAAAAAAYCIANAAFVQLNLIQDIVLRTVVYFLAATLMLWILLSNREAKGRLLELTSSSRSKWRSRVKWLVRPSR